MDSFHTSLLHLDTSKFVQDWSDQFYSETLQLFITLYVRKYGRFYPTVLPTDRTYCHKVGLALQGSCSDGYVICGPNKSDIDFLYIINRDVKDYLALYKLESNPNQPAHVIINVVPNFSSCKNEEDKEKVKQMIKLQGGQCILHVSNIRKVITDHVTKIREKKASTKIDISFDSKPHSCFRLQYTFTTQYATKVNIGNKIELFNDLINVITDTEDIKEAVKVIFNKISEEFHIYESNWETFKNDLIKDPSTVIEQYFNTLIEVFNNIMDSPKFYAACNFGDLVTYSFFLFLSILRSFGFNTIDDVIKNKSVLNDEHVIFWEEEIEHIVSIDSALICKKSITPKQEILECNFRIKLDKHIDKTKDIVEHLKNLFNDDEYSLNCFQEIFKLRIKDLVKAKIDNNIDWIISMSTNIIELLLQAICLLDTPRSLFDEKADDDHLIEVIPGLSFDGWPEVAENFDKRRRYWPNPIIVREIMKNGFHVVYKASHLNVEYDCRLSFSKAETMLSQGMTREQKESFYFMKNIFKDAVSKKRIFFKSYFIKSLCYWSFETKCQDNPKNIQLAYVIDILEKLFISVKNRKLPHFFIPEHNLFLDLGEEDYHELYSFLKWFGGTAIRNTDLSRNSRIIYEDEASDVDLFFYYEENSLYKSISLYLENFLEITDKEETSLEKKEKN